MKSTNSVVRDRTRIVTQSLRACSLLVAIATVATAATMATTATAQQTTTDALQKAYEHFTQRELKQTEAILRELLDQTGANDATTQEANYLLVRTLLLTHQVDKARKAASEAVRQHPDQPLSFVATGDVAFRESLFDSARSAYEQALDKTSSPVTGRLVTGNPVTAHRARAHQARAHQARAHLGLGRLAESERRLRTARHHYETAYQLAPEDADVLEAMSRAAADIDDTRRFLEAFVERATWEDPALLEASAQRAELIRVLDGRGACSRTWEDADDASSLDSASQPVVLDLPEARPAPGLAHRALRVEINDAKPIRALFDTGAPGLLLMSRRAAKKAAVEPITGGSIRGVGRSGSRDIEYGLVDRVRVGPVQWSDCVVSVAKGDIASGAAAILGISGFADLVLTIDHSRDQLQLRAHEQPLEDAWSWDRPAAPPEGFVEARVLGGNLRLPLRLGGVDAPPIAIDTGASLTILSLEEARRAAPTRPVRQVARGVSGTQELHTVIGLEIEVANRKLRPPRLWASDLASLSGWVGAKSGGFLGYDLLQRWVVTLDLRNAWVELRDAD